MKRAQPERKCRVLVRIHFIIVMITWTGLAPWEFESHITPPGAVVPWDGPRRGGLGQRRRKRRHLLEKETHLLTNLLVRIHFIIVMISWTGLAPWESEFPFTLPGAVLPWDWPRRWRHGQRRRRWRGRYPPTLNPKPQSPDPTQSTLNPKL